MFVLYHQQLLNACYGYLDSFSIYFEALVTSVFHKLFMALSLCRMEMLQENIIDISFLGGFEGRNEAYIISEGVKAHKDKVRAWQE